MGDITRKALYQKTMNLASLLDLSGPCGVPLCMDHVQDLTQLSDKALLEQSLKTPRAFEVLVARYQKEFLSRAFFVVKSRDEAEDVVQDTFVRIYRFAPRFKESHGTFKAWATTILMNVARTRYQRQARDWRRNAPLEPEHYESLAAPSDKDAVLAKDTIERALEKAPEEVAALLRLTFIDGLSYEDIAEREGVTVGAIKTRVHRGKKVLRAIITKLEI